MRLSYFLFMCIGALTYGQSVNLPQNVKDFAEILPKGYVSLHALKEDINGDGKKDLVMVMGVEKYEYIEGTGLEYEEVWKIDFEKQYRVLAIYLRNKKGSYDLFTWSDKFILTRYSPAQSEPLEEVYFTKKGVLVFKYYKFMTMGSWGVSSETLRFRYRDHKMELIGYDYGEGSRATATFDKYSVNYLTGKYKIHGEEVIDEDDTVVVPEQLSWHNFKINRLYRLEEVQSNGGFSYDMLRFWE
ncbi:MAG: hypothetical protein Q4G27_01295 [Flavobacteriaceae bacterium]|nr:hypothetical protein [Flavobacteriaceae bacterium]